MNKEQYEDLIRKLDFVGNNNSIDGDMRDVFNLLSMHFKSFTGVKNTPSGVNQRKLGVFNEQ